MFETIKEGKAVLKVPKLDKGKDVSKKLPVFYNPVMKFNRDVSIFLLNAIDRKDIQIALPLAGTGVRGIRLMKEFYKTYKKQP